MQSDEYEGAERRPRLWLWVLLLVLLAFLAGLAAAGYAVTHDRRAARMLGLVPAADLAAVQAQAAQRAAAPPPVPAPAPAPEAIAAADTELASRVDALQSKVDDIESQARAATGDASRAEGLLVAFAARRALDRGVALGYIEGLLRQRFGGTQPQAVAAILSASRVPVTLADLNAGLDVIAPTLTTGGGAPPTANWWQAFRRELANMVVIRRAGEASTQPEDRVAHAQRLLEAGQVDGALAEILRLPDHRAADKWIAAARRYLQGRGALDQIETAALLDPAPALPAAPAPPTPSADTPAADGTPD